MKLNLTLPLGNFFKTWRHFEELRSWKRKNEKVKNKSRMSFMLLYSMAKTGWKGEQRKMWNFGEKKLWLYFDQLYHMSNLNRSHCNKTTNQTTATSSPLKNNTRCSPSTSYYPVVICKLRKYLLNRCKRQNCIKVTSARQNVWDGCVCVSERTTQLGRSVKMEIRLKHPGPWSAISYITHVTVPPPTKSEMFWKICLVIWYRSSCYFSQ